MGYRRRGPSVARVYVYDSGRAPISALFIHCRQARSSIPPPRRCSVPGCEPGDGHGSGRRHLANGHVAAPAEWATRKSITVFPLHPWESAVIAPPPLLLPAMNIAGAASLLSWSPGAPRLPAPADAPSAAVVANAARSSCLSGRTGLALCSEYRVRAVHPC